jgi:hypothetical protein
MSFSSADVRIGGRIPLYRVVYAFLAILLLCPHFSARAANKDYVGPYTYIWGIDNNKFQSEAAALTSALSYMNSKKPDFVCDYFFNGPPSEWQVDASVDGIVYQDHRIFPIGSHLKDPATGDCNRLDGGDLGSTVIALFAKKGKDSAISLGTENVAAVDMKKEKIGTAAMSVRSAHFAMLENPLLRLPEICGILLLTINRQNRPAVWP